MKDYPVLYTAIREDVDVSITGDKDFSDVDVERPEILTPAQFLDRYVEGESKNYPTQNRTALCGTLSQLQVGHNVSRNKSRSAGPMGQQAGFFVLLSKAGPLFWQLRLPGFALYVCSLFYVFSTLWRKNAVLHLKINS